jgi:hypothetical protein
MQPASHHCPFLNRADSRCADRFHIDNLASAYQYCFDKYKHCPTYLELLSERRTRRGEGADDARGDLVQVTITASARNPARAA